MSAPDQLDWWVQFTYRERRAGERNATTLGRTWHRVVGYSRAEAAARSARFERVPALTLCGRGMRHLDYQRMVERPPLRGPLGGTPRVCGDCRRIGGEPA